MEDHERRWTRLVDAAAAVVTVVCVYGTWSVVGSNSSASKPLAVATLALLAVAVLALPVAVRRYRPWGPR